MNSLIVLSVSLVLVGSVLGGPHRAVRQSGWGSPPTSGWGSQGGTNITEEGASEAVGIGAAIAEHEANITVIGDSTVPALLSFSTGSGVGLYQSASNYQQSGINADGSSTAYQGNSAGNSGYAYDYLGGDAQGLTVDVQSNGWSAVEGEGAVGQIDALNHQGPSPQAASGWRKP